MFMPTADSALSDTQLRVAFDGDAVLFSDESEIIVKKHGLDTFFEHEKEFENKPLAQVTARVFNAASKYCKCVRFKRGTVFTPASLVNKK